jgi:hypothetical protein
MKNWFLLAALCACQSAPHPVTTPTTVPVGEVAELAAHRAAMIEWLRDYYEAGQYPTDAAGMPLSVFKDDKGVRCPMAELIYRSGHADLVDAVAKENNQVRLADVKAGPLHDWMLASGLTGNEIAMVQGAMEVDYSWMLNQESQETILARGVVRGRLETAVRSLQDGTAHSLEVASAQLPGKHVPAVAAVGNGKVIPQAALASASRVPRPAPRSVRCPARSESVAWRPRPR